VAIHRGFRGQVNGFRGQVNGFRGQVNRHAPAIC
jgi:hypothetical protein